MPKLKVATNKTESMSNPISIRLVQIKGVKKKGWKSMKTLRNKSNPNMLQNPWNCIMTVRTHRTKRTTMKIIPSMKLALFGV